MRHCCSYPWYSGTTGSNQIPNCHSDARFSGLASDESQTTSSYSKDSGIRTGTIPGYTVLPLFTPTRHGVPICDSALPALGLFYRGRLKVHQLAKTTAWRAENDTLDVMSVERDPKGFRRKVVGALLVVFLGFASRASGRDVWGAG